MWGTFAHRKQMHRTESKIEVTRGWGTGGWELLLFRGTGVSIWDDENIVWLGGGARYTTVWTPLMLVNCTRKNG